MEFKLSDYIQTIQLVLENNGIFRLYPKGTSMLPLIRQGKDSVCLAKADKHLKKGDIAFYRRLDGSFVLHRVINSKNGIYTMCGDNQTSPEPAVTHSQIIGKAVKIYRKDKCIPLSNIGYRIYLFLWQSFTVRKLFFTLRKIFKKLRRRIKNGC